MIQNIMDTVIYQISRLPKMSISMILGAINTYCLAKGYIDAATATLISSIFVALGISVNIMTNNGAVQSNTKSENVTM